MPATQSPEKSTDRLLLLIEKPLSKGETILGRLDASHSETGKPVHSDLLRLLTHLSYPNDVARQVWSGFAVHRATLERRLGRDVGVRVALFDYLLNVDPKLSNPKIIELSDYEQTQKSAISDHLTGLFNRAHFDVSIKREINRCRRYGQEVSLILLDIDDFKNVNDSFGHPTGDTVLRQVGRLLGQRVRDIDVAARYGGEEFSIILPETPRMSAYVVAERIRSEIERFFRRKNVEDRALGVTVSGGIAAYPEDADALEALLSRADEALYRAKRGGKNQVAVYYREKRRSNRFNLETRAIRVQIQGSSTRSCKAVNISKSGIFLQTSRPLELGQSLRMNLEARRNGKLSLRGEVVRLEENEAASKKKVFGAGVRFRFARRGAPQELSRFIRQNAAADV